MSRTRSIEWTPVGAAKELAEEAISLGGDDRAALAVFRRFFKEQHRPRFPAGSHAPGDAVLPEGRVWELLLRELARDRRRQRGMYFTPLPLVRFILDNIERGVRNFPDPLHVIDPACGYGGFLIEAGRRLPAVRLTGFEICRSTRLVARMVCRRELQTPPRLIHTNPLLAGESLRSAILGRPEASLMPVIVGNPPWSNFGRLNRGPWIDCLLADYRNGLAERKTNLADDSIKFIRWAQYWVEQAGRGIVAFVTPNTWLDGLTHRRMRQSLLESFDEMQLVDLGGAHAGDGDENVFGVRSGVAMVMLVRRRAERVSARLARCAITSLHGSRTEKFAAITGSDRRGLIAREIRPAAPDWRLTAKAERRGSSARAQEYASYWPLDRIFRHYTSGVQTKNDSVFVGFTPEQVAKQVKRWLAKQVNASAFDARHIQPYLLAPFDRRFVYYDPRVLGRARLAVMRHMLRPNLGLVFMRQSTCRGQYDHFLAVDGLVSDRVFYSRQGAPFLAPLWLWQPVEKRDRGQETGDSGQETAANELALGAPYSVLGSNFQSQFLEAFASTLRIPACEPVPVFHYLYAIAHWPTYRRRFADALCRGFPRIPLPRDVESFHALSRLGLELVQLHISPGIPLSDIPSLRESGEAFRLGGYDVLKRWAGPRTRHRLACCDKRELERLAWIGHETARLMQEIDVQLPQPPPPGVSIESTSPALTST